VVSEVNRDRQFGEDIQQFNAGILQNKGGSKETSLHQKESRNSIPIEAIDRSEAKPKIPQFDLAEDIMAEQRKITAVRRKAPGKKIEHLKKEQDTKSVSGPARKSIPTSPEQEKVIAEIVAKDIERLFRG